VIPTLESFGIEVSEGKEDKVRYVQFKKETPEGPASQAEDEGQHNRAGDGTDSDAVPSDADTYAAETPGTAETPYFPENSKYTKKPIDRGDVLQGGKNAASAVPVVGEAYLSHSEGDSISDDAVTGGDYAVPTDDPLDETEVF
jgi:hypothetical protein